MAFHFSNNSFAQKYEKIHDKAILVDTHNDILSTAIEKGYSFEKDITGKTHIDLQRMKKGSIDVQIFSVWCDGNKQNPFAWANTEIDTLYA
jgi:membrane dipeptidase